VRYPISFAQQRLLAVNPLGTVPYAVWLDGRLDIADLRLAMAAMVGRHAALRTRIDTAEQVVAETGSVAVDHVVLPASAADVQRAESIAAELTARPFDLAAGPLVRAAVIETDRHGSLFVLVAHRVIADDAALAILVGELFAVYESGSVVLPDLWMDYGDYAVWQRERLAGEELARQLDQWREPLRDAPRTLALPTDRPRPEVRSLRSAQVTATASAERLAVLTGYAVVLARYAGQADVVIGVPVSGRIRVELAPIVGPFADTVPVRISLAAAPTFAELLDRVRDVTTAALAHDELPLAKLAAELGLAEPVVRFAFEPSPEPEPPGLRHRVPYPPAAESELDLTTGDSTLTLTYRTDLFGEPFADRFLRSVVMVLDQAGQAPDTPVAELPVLLPGEGVFRPSAPPVVSPQDPVEVTMAGIWAELLHTTEPIGVDDNLFVLGGTSLTAVRFASRVADTYGVLLPMNRIFETPTIAALAKIVSADPAFPDDTTRDAELAALPDEDLDDLLRAVLAARDRRRADRGDGR
jgi:acyl carrier protein